MLSWEGSWGYWKTLDKQGRSALEGLSIVTSARGCTSSTTSRRPTRVDQQKQGVPKRRSHQFNFQIYFIYFCCCCRLGILVEKEITIYLPVVAKRDRFQSERRGRRAVRRSLRPRETRQGTWRRCPPEKQTDISFTFTPQGPPYSKKKYIIQNNREKKSACVGDIPNSNLFMHEVTKYS